MSDLPDVEATVKVLKSIMSEGVDLVSEKRRFQDFLRDYAGRARTEQGLKLERKHLNVLMSGMRYPRFDAVVGLGDWLSCQEGYDKALCQWVEVVWSKSLSLATDIELDSKHKSEGEKRAPPSGRAGAPAQCGGAGEASGSGGKASGGGGPWTSRTGKGTTSRARRRTTSRPVQSVEAFRDRLRIGGEGPAMVVVPPGRFRMGSPSAETGRYDNEGPVHTVTISRPIAMGQYPVTFADYDRYVSAMGAERSTDEDSGFVKTFFEKKPERPADEGWGRGRMPVINVHWYGAKAYASWLSEQTGKRYRLPSESEWEYAARAGTETAYSWGDEINCSQARYGRRYGGECSNSGDGPVPVGSFEPNPFGLYDLHGNVWEWVEDGWHDNYEGAPSDGSAWTGGDDGSLRVMRGGAWFSYPRYVRSAVRFGDPPSRRSIAYGFRLAQDLNP